MEFLVKVEFPTSFPLQYEFAFDTNYEYACRIEIQLDSNKRKVHISGNQVDRISCSSSISDWALFDLSYNGNTYQFPVQLSNQVVFMERVCVGLCTD